MSLIVTGAVGIDTIESPAGKAEQVIGGSGIYFTAAASYFTQPRLVTAVGDDFPDAFVELFHHFNVDVAGLERRAGSKTFRWHGKYRDDNINERDTLGVELNILLEALPPVPTSYVDSEFVFLAVTSPDNQLALLDKFPQRKLVVMDTIDFYIEQMRDTLLEVVSRVDGVIINDSEAKLLTGESNMVHAAQWICDRGPTFAIIKKGEHGVIMKHRDGWVALPAYPADQVVDPTGAGDSFAGGFMGHLAATGDLSLNNLRKGLAYGTMVASFNIEDFSLGRMKTLERHEIDQRLNAFTNMVNLA